MRYLSLLLVFCLGIGCSNPATTKKSESPEWALLPFLKADDANPVIKHDVHSVFICPVRNTPVHWEEKDVFNPAAIIRHDTLFLLYRAEDSIGRFAGTSRIGLAWSTDGLHFTKHITPVLYPGNDSAKKYEWEGGCEDPRIVEDENGTYYLNYTSYDGDKARLMVASSTDLYHWKKYGPAFANAGNGKYLNYWSKSGAVVADFKTGTPVAKKIKGKYWMYWGDTDIFLASSDDLVNWTPVEKNNGELFPVFGPRKGKFDSDLVEPGPPAMFTDKGIVLIYNSRNVQGKGDTSLAEGTYAASQILLDKKDPGKVVDRMKSYFLNPDKPYEIYGQVNQVCFVEGLVRYKGKWFLYYGTADSKIAVAVK
ncbi:MAG TPA: glycoside hydrolase family 130 protein [Chitinophagaceae bacterium]|nr:glycoside hydrolase family 130 protein [Chitinophagaceae bacterium]